MLYLLDTANLEEIKRAYDLYPMDGVTTNPSIISKENRDFIKILKDIRNIIGEDSMLHAQVLAENSDDIIKEAKYIKEQVGGNIYIKVPVTKQGIKAMKLLKKEKFSITATAVITPQQALIAAKAGADFVAPYVNRIDNISGNGVDVTDQIIQLFKVHDINTKVLAASFKNVQQVQDVAIIGSQSVTVNSEIMDKLLEHMLTDWSVEQFIKDWEKTYNKKTIL